MVRIAGVDLPDKKHVCIALTHIFGIGRSRAMKICQETGVKSDIQIGKISDDEVEKLRKEVAKYTVGGDLEREILSNIMELKAKKTYRGDRHRRGLPARGQRTRTNARTCKKRRGKKKS